MHLPFFETLARRLRRQRDVSGERRQPAAEPEKYPWEATYPEGIDWRATIEPRPLTALLDDAAAERVYAAVDKDGSGQIDVHELRDAASGHEVWGWWFWCVYMTFRGFG